MVVCVRLVVGLIDVPVMAGRHVVSQLMSEAVVASGAAESDDAEPMALE